MHKSSIKKTMLAVGMMSVTFHANANEVVNVVSTEASVSSYEKSVAEGLNIHNKGDINNGNSNVINISNKINKENGFMEFEPPILKALINDAENRYELVSSSMVGSHLKSYVFVDKMGKYNVIYKTKDNKILVGKVFEMDGSEVSNSLLPAKKVVGETEEKSKSETAENTDKKKTARERLEEAFGFELKGSIKPDKKAYVIYDPNCGYCKQLYSMTSVGTGVTIKWIPVDYLHSTSSSLIEYSRLGEKQFKEVMTGNGSNKQPSLDTTSELSKNSVMMRDFGIRGAPAIIFEDNGRLTLQPGLPSYEWVKKEFML
jgi:hypothetical protein